MVLERRKSKTDEQLLVERAKRIIFLTIYRLKYIRSNVGLGTKVRLNRATSLENDIYIYPFVDIRASEIGKGSYISSHSELPFTKIGKFCQIGSYVRIIIGDHPLGENISTHPAFYSNLAQAGFRFKKISNYREFKRVDDNPRAKVVEIGNDVWIGDHVKILNGVRIGDGAVIGTGSIVTHDIEPYTIVAGVPARLIRKRFDDKTIEYLVKHPWFDISLETLANNVEAFESIHNYKKFIERQ